MSRIKLDIINELHKPARKKFQRRRIIIKGIRDLWVSDLADFKSYSRENRGYKYILVVINAFSKYLWTEAIKNKSGEEVKKAMQKILNTGDVPTNLQTDAGKEYYNHQFKGLMEKYNINHYSTFSSTKASIAERIIRTLKEKLYKEFSLRGTYKWLDILENITNQYNNTKHRTIGMKPKDVTGDKERILLSTVYNHPKIITKRLFSENDVVRISKYKSIFDKAYTPNWSTELFKITKVQITNPTTYLLEDMNGRPILGGFYEKELQKVKHENVYLVEKVLRRKGKKVFVKWLGLDKSHNSWISKDNVL